MLTKVDITPKIFSDSLEIMCMYIDRMRIDEDLDTIPDMVNRFNERVLASKDTSKDQLRRLAVYAIDYIYRFSSTLKMRDKYTDAYFTKAIAKLGHQRLKKRMDEDRFDMDESLENMKAIAAESPEMADIFARMIEAELELIRQEKNQKVNG